MVQLQFICNQLIHSIPKVWKGIFSKFREYQKCGFPAFSLNKISSNLLFEQTEWQGNL